MVIKKATAIIQARYNSTRFPGKILKDKKTLLEIQIDRLKKSKRINILLCLYSKPEDRAIIELSKKLSFSKGLKKRIRKIL